MAVLLNPEKYRNQILTITGPKALSYAEAVAVLNDVLGKDANYIVVSDEDAINAMTGMKFPESWKLHSLCSTINCFFFKISIKEATFINTIVAR